jgi:hypothetical protein
VRVALCALVAGSILLTACDKSSGRTAFDPPQEDDRVVREHAQRILGAAEECRFDEIQTLVAPGRQVFVQTPDAGNSAAAVYAAITRCEARVEFRDVKIGSAEFDEYPGYLDVLSVSLSGEWRVVASGLDREIEWLALDARYYFALIDGQWRLVNSWIP